MSAQDAFCSDSVPQARPPGRTLSRLRL